MKLLAIETATEACSAALWIDGQIHEEFKEAPRLHGELILPMVDVCLQQAGLSMTQLDALAFGRGPGSFTGVRMATGVAQGLAFASDLPVVAISTLAALAQSVVEEAGSAPIFTALDARMQEVYWGVYVRDDAGELQLKGSEQVLPASMVQTEEFASGLGVGHGWRTYEGALKQAIGGPLVACYPDRLPGAAAVATLGAQAYKAGFGVPAEQALPVYLRDNVAKKKARG